LYGILVLTSLITLVALVAWGRVERHWVSLAILALLIVTRCVTPYEALRFVDWDVLGLILGMSILTEHLKQSGFVDLVASLIKKRISNTRTLAFVLSLCAGIVSIALENVSVVILFTPIALTICKTVGVNPVPIVIGVALASNLAGSATMIGDPPAIITAGYLNLAFGDFIWYRGKPSMFFLTLASMIASCMVLSMLTPRIRLNASKTSNVNVDRAYIAESSIALSIKITLLSLRHYLGISLTFSAIVALSFISIARLLHRDFESIKKAFVNGFDWKTIAFLIGVFVLSGAFAKHGLAQQTANAMLSLVHRDLFMLTSLLVWFSVLVSAFIDNVPYITTMLPVIKAIAQELHVEPITIAWAVLLGTTLGGNLTFIGASANVVAVRKLEEEGYKITFVDFLKLSAPFNTVSVGLGWILYEVIWVLPSSF